MNVLRVLPLKAKGKAHKSNKVEEQTKSVSRHNEQYQQEILRTFFVISLMNVTCKFYAAKLIMSHHIGVKVKLNQFRVGVSIAQRV